MMQNELNGINSKFHRKLKEIDKYYLKQSKEIKRKHKAELNSFKAQLELSMPLTPKPSAELLVSIMRQQMLAKQRKYVEAHKEQQWARRIQERDQEIWNRRRGDKIVAHKALLMERQRKEGSCLEEKVQRMKGEAIQEKELMMSRLIFKYCSMKKETKAKNMKTEELLSTTKERSRSFKSLNNSFRSLMIKTKIT